MPLRAESFRDMLMVGLTAVGTMLATITPEPALATGDKALSRPTLTCVDATQVSVDVKVCAGASGTPAGFVLKWLEGDATTGWPSNDADACLAYFWSKGRGHYLAPGQCITVNIGELLATEASRTSCAALLKCGTSYAFQAWARPTATKTRSRYAGPLYCSTLACTPPAESCTYTQGYWDTHGPQPKGNNPYAWPQDVKDAGGFEVGNVFYTNDQLQAILRAAPKGNGLVSLAHQLIAAKLNVANGSDSSAIAATIAAADTLIGALVIPPVGTGSLTPKETSDLNDALADYNEGKTGPGHCN